MLDHSSVRTAGKVVQFHQHNEHVVRLTPPGEALMALMRFQETFAGLCREDRAFLYDELRIALEEVGRE